MSLLHRIWMDEAGFVVSTELVLIATILVIGLVVGLAQAGFRRLRTVNRSSNLVNNRVPDTQAPSSSCPRLP